MTYMHPRHRLVFELLSWTWRTARSGVLWLWRSVRGERKKSGDAAYTVKRGATDSPSIMEKPSVEELRRVALFDVGDKAYLTTSGAWTVTARYWSASKGIVYDLRYDYNGVKLERIEEREMTRTAKGVSLGR